MFTKQQRLVAASIALVLGLFLLLVPMHPAGWMLVLLAGLILYGYWRYPPIHLLLQHVSQGQLAQADTILAEIGAPTGLPPTQRAYYDFALGWMHLHRDMPTAAHDCLTQALTQGLRTSNDTAMAYGLLARSAMQQGQVEQAHAYLQHAQSLPCKPPVAAEIQRVETALQVLHE